ncbi:unnamed protein product [Didymodactylos carnosus]|uniref:Uncharacterized protein n=1 Tax=Didymodactylos carnosus TaxID=1234261 RepID=A0A814SIE6_9BILA|nr:unnamed protein product [Didymodactylos carnosus]CAF1308756.1 unnamed protein product [Didymodactylos carnosus]CAF3911407.1 unnamed protein product [Didymodactylos carnosus]CAF4116202.1 unnamed protein product [Didymodactylos carnosus]
MTDLTQNPHILPLNYDDNDQNNDEPVSDSSSIDSDIEINDLSQTLNDDFVKIDLGLGYSISEEKENGLPTIRLLIKRF